METNDCAKPPDASISGEGYSNAIFAVRQSSLALAETNRIAQNRFNEKMSARRHDILSRQQALHQQTRDLQPMLQKKLAANFAARQNSHHQTVANNNHRKAEFNAALANTRARVRVTAQQVGRTKFEAREREQAEKKRQEVERQIQADNARITEEHNAQIAELQRQIDETQRQFDETQRQAEEHQRQSNENYVQKVISAQEESSQVHLSAVTMRKEEAAARCQIYDQEKQEIDRFKEQHENSIQGALSNHQLSRNNNEKELLVLHSLSSDIQNHISNHSNKKSIAENWPRETEERLALLHTHLPMIQWQMNDWIYPEVINHLKESCIDFLDEKITIHDIQAEIFNAENQVVAHEEKWLRTIFFDAENEIERLRYTTNEDQLVGSIKPIVQDVLNKIK